MRTSHQIEVESAPIIAIIMTSKNLSNLRLTTTPEK